MASDRPTLGTRIRRARERARLSQEQLATLVGASVRAVGDWENDRRKPRNRLGALEEVLRVTLTDDAPQPAVPRRVVDAIRASVPEEDQDEAIEAVRRTMRGEPQPPPTGPGAVSPPGGTRRRTG